MADPSSTLNDRLAELRSSFRSGLATRIEELEAAIEIVAASEDSPDALSALERVQQIAHQLAGSGTTFGFPEITRNARELEEICETPLAAKIGPTQADQQRIIDFIEFLRLQSASSPAVDEAVSPDDSAEERSNPDEDAPRKWRVLLVEDDRAQARAVEEFLRSDRYSITFAETGGAALEAISETLPDAILLDLMLPDMDGIDILRQVAERQLPCVVVVITAHGSVNRAVEAMRLGAYDFIIKPFNVTRLQITLRNALEKHRLSRIVETFQGLDRSDYFGFVGASLPMQAVYRIIDSAAGSKATVFISGESGTGKEVCAEAIHRKSPRAEKPFVPINCGAIPKDLMESEIFGHVKGAFTGAVADREGAAQQANGGTLFLDEVCELDLSLQTKLLRFVQTGTCQKVGGERTEVVDVRFVCATNRDPMAEVAAGRFREDLFYRLHVVPIQLPPLRERGDDIILIAERLLRQYSEEEGKRLARFSAETKTIFQNFPWPGNVREVQNVLRHITVLNDGDEVTMDMLPPPLDRSEKQTFAAPPSSAPRPSENPPPTTYANDMAKERESIRPLSEVERDAIDHAISQCDGNIPKAAHFLGVSASTIYRKKQVWEDNDAKSAPTAS